LVKQLLIFLQEFLQLFCSQAEPVACAIRGDSEIQGIKLPGGKDGEYIETKLCMFADDTQLFNKNDESVKKSVSTFPNVDTIFHFIYY
jgi:hypothetical protein